MATAVIGVLAAGGGALMSAPRAEAICAAPSIDVDPDHGSAGASVKITGKGFVSECRDSFVCEVGSPCPPPSEQGPVEPVDSVVIAFAQGDATTELATVKPGDDYAFEATVQVPQTARPGPASIEARPSNRGQILPASFTVEPASPAVLGSSQDRGPLPATGLANGYGAALAACAIASLLWRLGRDPRLAATRSRSA